MWWTYGPKLGVVRCNQLRISGSFGSVKRPRIFPQSSIARTHVVGFLLKFGAWCIVGFHRMSNSDKIQDSGRQPYWTYSNHNISPRIVRFRLTFGLPRVGLGGCHPPPPPSFFASYDYFIKKIRLFSAQRWHVQFSQFYRRRKRNF